MMLLKLICISIVTIFIGKLICTLLNINELSGNIMYIMGVIDGVVSSYIIIDHYEDKQ